MNLLFIFTLTDAGSIFTIIGTFVAIIALLKRVKKLKEQTEELNELNPSLEVLENYDVVWKKITSIFQNELKEGNHISLKNIGLDLERILPNIGEFVTKTIKADKRLSLSYCGLIINPDADLIKPVINGNSNITSEFVTSSLKRLELLKNDFRINTNVTFEVRKYQLPPSIHGIVINNKHLFLGFTEFQNGKIFGADSPYIYLKYDPNIIATRHYFKFYNDWFDYYWNN